MKAAVLATLAIVAAWLFWDPSFTDEVTLYTAQCEGNNKLYPPSHWIRSDVGNWLENYNKSVADCKPRTFSTTTYRLNKVRGEVAYMAAGSVQRLVDCTFFNNSNWACYYSGSGQLPFVVINGRQGKNTKIEASLFYHSLFSVSKWQYYLIGVLELISPPGRGSALLIPDQFESYR